MMKEAAGSTSRHRTDIYSDIPTELVATGSNPPKQIGSDDNNDDLFNPTYPATVVCNSSNNELTILKYNEYSSSSSSKGHDPSGIMLCPHPPPPPPPHFTKWLSAKSNPAQQSLECSYLIPVVVPPPPLPPTFRRTCVSFTASTISTSLVSPIPPPPLEMMQPPPPPPVSLEYESTSSLNPTNTSEVDSSGIPHYTATEVTEVVFEAIESPPSVISQWVAVETSSAAEVEVVVGMWERHTKGIGGKLLERMGYIRGLGLGKSSQGRLEPVEAVNCCGLGFQGNETDQIDGEPDAGSSDAHPGSKRSLAEFGETLYSSVKTKPQGSGGFKKKKIGHATEGNKKKETVFDFMNKIPSSSAQVDKMAIKKIAPRKEIKKITAKSAF